MTSNQKTRTYQQAQEILASIPPGMKYQPGDRILFLREIVRWLGFDQVTSRIIRLAGTNGKGSTAKLVSRLLMANGQTVAGFNSPYLFEVREELSFQDQAITPTDFSRAFFTLLDVLAAHQVDLLADLSFFEAVFLTGVAFYVQKDPDYLVIEAGLGGELDVTNALPRSDYTILTQIGLDHTAILGPTLADIATTKVRMVRPGETIITAADQQPIVREVLLAVSRDRKNRVFAADQVTVVNLTKGAENEQRFVDVMVGQQRLTGLPLALAGSYQLANLKTALMVWQVLAQVDQVIPESLSALRAGLAQAHLAGRFDYLLPEPHPLIVDGAHNIDGIQALVATLKRSFPGRRLVIIVGFLADKDTKACVQALVTLGNATFIVTTPANADRQLAANDLARVFSQETAASRVLSIANPGQAVDYARDHYQQAGDVIVATGSFYLIKEVIKAVTGEASLG